MNRADWKAMTAVAAEAGVDDQVQSLLGCVWGRAVATPDDTEPCQDAAVQIVVVHNGSASAALKLCARHKERLDQETTPRDGREEGSDG